MDLKWMLLLLIIYSHFLRVGRFLRLNIYFFCYFQGEGMDLKWISLLLIIHVHFLRVGRYLKPNTYIFCNCSAGVGRTGTFIVIDAMIDMMEAEQKVDVFGFVSRIRNQRPQLVQTDVSFIFVLAFAAWWWRWWCCDGDLMTSLRVL